MRPEGDKPPATPAECRAELDRVIQSPPFRSAPRLIAFLRYIVEQTVAGGAPHLKGYTIATEALGRNASFDPQTDPIVRVEAGRLRRALARYYAEFGRDDEIVIELSPGTYVPTFRRRTFALGRGSIPAAARDFIHSEERRQWRLVTYLAILALAVSLAFNVAWWRTDSPEVSAASTVGAGLRLTANPFPILHVEPLNEPHLPPQLSSALQKIGSRLRDALTLSEDVVLAADAKFAATGMVPVLPAVDFRIIPSVEISAEGTVNLTFRLIDVHSNTVAWTKTFASISAEATADIGDSVADADMIVRALVATLAHPNGVIHSIARRQRTTDRTVDPRYTCLLDHYEMMSAYEPGRRGQIRSCLEQATAADPNFMLGFVALAEVNIREHFAAADSPGAKPWLERALAEARRATELQPNSARAHGMLMWALFAGRNTIAAVHAGERALMLNPQDLLIKADVGAIILKSGYVEQGYTVLKQAAEGWPDRPPRVNFSLFSGAYLTGDFAAANLYANIIMTDKYHSVLFARALAAAKLGDMKSAHKALAQLHMEQPAWAIAPRRLIARLFASEDIIDRMAADLAAIAESEAN